MIPSKKAKTVDSSCENNDATRPNQLRHNEATPSFLYDLGDELKRKTSLREGVEKSIEISQQKGRCLFPGSPVICQLIQAANLFQKLGVEEVIFLALTSKQLFIQLSPLIEGHFLFHYRDNTIIQHYHPKKLFISTFNLEGLFTDPFLSKVYKIKFDSSYNFEVPKLPSSVTHIHFGDRMNQPITDKNLPTTTQSIVFGKYYNQAITTLPHKITQLEMNEFYRQPFNNCSQCITHLKFNTWFNHPVSAINLPLI
eukprot:TRINITY_DN3658_c0_g8_i1.p1 TRINITY_DN3658_c0_g8~~TRINITY_DN3658_c0_g8_i1.p1  ORF type:complete len:254 (+),score=45.71 TRINITY_DN3658_c0_g8_i1:160-921(+)